jgi:hypothetical protein
MGKTQGKGYLTKLLPFNPMASKMGALVFFVHPFSILRNNSHSYFRCIVSDNN